MKYKMLLIIILVTFCAIGFTNNIYAINDSDVVYEGYQNYNNSRVSCGTNSKHAKPLIDNIPKSIPKLTHRIYLIIQIAVPIVLVVLGSIDLFKGITSQKEEEVKKGQQMFVKRLIYAALVFFVFMIVKLLVDVSADSSSAIINCAECFIDNKCNS